MGAIRGKTHPARPAGNVEQLLESYYSQLLKWGAVLTRGDVGMTGEIVHDLCLHLTLSQPDLSQVANLDGYLYTCLKNIYVSGLARSARDVVQCVGTADFDCIQFALDTISPDEHLQRQNDLRRICSFAVWRKESSKSASYLILLFFFGYCRREVAQIARLPIAAIYNKLKVARTEIKAHLVESATLRILSHNEPPSPALRVSIVPIAELVDELQALILTAKSSDCLPEEALLADYRSATLKPISCGLLAHIVSCVRCLSLIDRHFKWPTLDDREPPVGPDSIDTGIGSGKGLSFEQMMLSVRERGRRIYEHRPQTLSIAVDGKIAACHDVQSQQSTLSARLERPENAQFIEVFTEQRIRLALLTIDDIPPEGAGLRSQRVALSDERWLELDLHFDGLGLQSTVTYFDRALAPSPLADSADENAAPEPVSLAPESSIRSAAVASRAMDSLLVRVLAIVRTSIRTPRFAWAFTLTAVLCAAGLLVSRLTRSPLQAQQLLSRSAEIESSTLLGHAEHRILRIDEFDATGHITEEATIDLWKDGGGRAMRKLYNSRHQLIAALWQNQDGKSGSYAADDERTLSGADREMAASDVWKLDVSAESFREFAGQRVEARKAGAGYELASLAPMSDRLQLVSAVLVLDGRLHAIGETLRFSRGSRIQEVRWNETTDEVRPSSSVPRSVFDPTDIGTGRANDREPSKGTNRSRLQGTLPEVRVIRLQIAVLHALFELGADAGEPIQVTRTPDGHIRISGTVASTARDQQIRASIDSLPDRELVDFKLATSDGVRTQAPATRGAGSVPTNVYDFAQSNAPMEPLLNSYFARKGWSGDRVNAAVTNFSREALEHAQRALQHAYALERLGESFTPGELQFSGTESQRQWAEMASHHAAALKNELGSLHDQLVPLVSRSEPSQPLVTTSISISSPAEFSLAASRLLRQVQTMYGRIGGAFASGNGPKEADATSVLLDAEQSIPLNSASQVNAFAARLTESEKSDSSKPLLNHSNAAPRSNESNR